MKRIFGLFALVTVFSLATFADVRLPDTPKPTPSPKEERKSIDMNFEILIEKDAKEARLLIPKDQIKELRAQLDALDGGSNAAFMSFSRTQTIVGGLFLSLAFVAGGVWLSRARGKGGFKPHKAVVAGAVLIFGGALTVATFANVGPPLEARSITGKIFSDSVHRYKQAWGKVKVETSDNSSIILIVPDVPRDKPTNEE